MGQRKPYGSKLQESGGLRIENSARNVDVRDGVAVEQKIAALQVMKKREKETRKAIPATRAALRSGGSAVFSLARIVTLRSRGLACSRSEVIPDASVRGKSGNARQSLRE